MNRPEELKVGPRNVAMLVNGDEVYGVGTIEKLYSDAWPDMLFVCTRRGPMHEWLKEHHPRVMLIDGLSDLSLRGYLGSLAGLVRSWRKAKNDAKQLHRRLEGQDIKIIHVHWLSHQLISGHMRRYGYKTVWQINNNTNRERIFDTGHKLNILLARWGADFLLPASNYIAKNWKDSGVSLKTVHNSAKPVYATGPTKKNSSSLRCVAAGRLSKSKGHHIAVDAILKLISENHDVCLDIYGGPLEDNTYAKDLLRKIKIARAEDKISLKGFCGNLRELHRLYDVGLQCRIDPEPCSLWVCETLVDGLPLVASATGGTPELVQDGVTGFLVPPNDTEALTEKLRCLCHDPLLKNKMALAAYQRGKTHFTETRMMSETLHCYHSI